MFPRHCHGHAKVVLCDVVDDGGGDVLVGEEGLIGDELHEQGVCLDAHVLVEIVLVADDGGGAGGAVRAGRGRGPGAGPDGVVGADGDAGRGGGAGAAALGGGLEEDLVLDGLGQARGQRDEVVGLEAAERVVPGAEEGVVADLGRLGGLFGEGEDGLVRGHEGHERLQDSHDDGWRDVGGDGDAVAVLPRGPHGRR